MNLQVIPVLSALNYLKYYTFIIEYHSVWTMYGMKCVIYGV